MKVSGPDYWRRGYGDTVTLERPALVEQRIWPDGQTPGQMSSEEFWGDTPKRFFD